MIHTLIVATFILYQCLAAENMKPQLSCECGWRNTKRILGGKETLPNEYPWMVSLIHRYDNVHFCGGTIITQWHVLTAAHCTKGEWWYRILLCVGLHDVNECKNEKYSKIERKIYKVHDVKYYGGFNYSTKTQDISIIVTKTQIFFTQFVGPACFPNQTFKSDLDNEISKVLGWGIGDVQKVSNKLSEIDVKVIPHMTCSKQVTALDTLPTQICIVALSGEPCHGDSGGPVVWFDPDIDRYTIAGLISYSTGTCNHHICPTVTTDVSFYRNWIYDKTKGSHIPFINKRKGTLCEKKGNS